MKAINCLLWECLAIVPSALMAQTTNSQPNIVLILADDMGRECLGCYGSTYHTPNLDRLSEIGVRFDNCFSQPLSTPSRVQLMTGKYNNKNYSRFGHLNQTEKTFAHLAKDAGYTTMIAGKWQLGRNKNLPHHFGFDRYCLWQLSYDRMIKERYAAPLIEQDGGIKLYSNDEYGPDIFAQYVTDFIEENKAKPFFVYYPMVLVHDPFYPTPQSDVWEDPSMREVRNNANFPKMVEHVDKNVGMIFNKLENLNLLSNTIIIFIGDNGTNRKIRTTMKDGSVVRGGKGLTSDTGVRVPMIVYWGKSVYREHECTDMIDFTDFMPTFAEAMNTKVPKEWDIDGQSFLPQIKGKKGKAREWVFCHYDSRFGTSGSKNAKQFFRDVRYKLYSDGNFYDTINNPEETNPIKKGRGSAEAEKSRKKLEKLFLTIPAWKVGDPAVPMCILPEFPLLETPKDMGLDQILHSY